MSEGICWSADEMARLRRSFRVSHRGAIWRSTLSRIDEDGRLHVDSRPHGIEIDAWRHAAAGIIDCASRDYNQAEAAFLASFRRYRDGVVGFRPRSAALRRVAHDANAAVFHVASAYAVTWKSLDTAKPHGVALEATVPQWLTWALSELQGRDSLSPPPLEYWLERHGG